jgi:hypothetical protein
MHLVFGWKLKENNYYLPTKHFFQSFCNKIMILLHNLQQLSNQINLQELDVVAN